MILAFVCSGVQLSGVGGWRWGGGCGQLRGSSGVCVSSAGSGGFGHWSNPHSLVLVP